MNSSNKYIQKWSADKLILLLDTKLTENELVKKLKRSLMSILMQRAQFVPEFISWVKSKRYDSSKISKTIIKEFLEEKEGNSQGEDKENVDFAKPIKLSEIQREKLINFLKEMFYHVELKKRDFRVCY